MFFIAIFPSEKNPYKKKRDTAILSEMVARSAGLSAERTACSSPPAAVSKHGQFCSFYFHCLLEEAVKSVGAFDFVPMPREIEDPRQVVQPVADSQTNTHCTNCV